MLSKLTLATPDKTQIIVSFLSKMKDELHELDTNDQIMQKAVSDSFSEGVKWFLFSDENGNYFGTCYLQSVHNYWRIKKRYYLGGFYILLSHRNKGRFKELNRQLKDWVIQNNGVQIYSHIHKDNEKSQRAFASVGMEPIEYLLYIYDWEQ